MEVVRITYKHWTKDKQLVVEGSLPKELNNGTSDRYVVRQSDGTFEDVLKHTVISMEKIRD